MVVGIDSFVFLAIPLFIMAGRLMNEGGITDRIFSFARAMVGHLRGGLGHANIVASMIFFRNVRFGRRRCWRAWAHRDQGDERSRLSEILLRSSHSCLLCHRAGHSPQHSDGAVRRVGRSFGGETLSWRGDTGNSGGSVAHDSGFHIESHTRLSQGCPGFCTRVHKTSWARRSSRAYTCHHYRRDTWRGLHTDGGGGGRSRLRVRDLVLRVSNDSFSGRAADCTRDNGDDCRGDFS
jgi:hypothetical protein